MYRWSRRKAWLSCQSPYHTSAKKEKGRLQKLYLPVWEGNEVKQHLRCRWGEGRGENAEGVLKVGGKGGWSKGVLGRLNIFQNLLTGGEPGHVSAEGGKGDRLKGKEKR